MFDVASGDFIVKTPYVAPLNEIRAAADLSSFAKGWRAAMPHYPRNTA